MQNILEQNLDMATALLAGEKLKELIMPGSSQDEKGGMLAGLMVQLKLELPFDRVVTIGTVIIPILLVTLVFTRNFAGQCVYQPLDGALAVPLKTNTVMYTRAGGTFCPLWCLTISINLSLFIELVH